MKKIKNYILAFIIPLILCLIILYLKNILFNIENIYVSDLRLQHMPFLNYLKNILLNKASLQYSFYAGMGSPMIATMIFYCISPINVLLLLIKDIRYAIIFIYIIKISFSGLTMYILLKNKFKHDSFMTIMFSTCYALSSFVINYFFCIFWFDSIYLAPLVMLGVDKIIEKEKINLLYIIALSLAIICNIQMGFGLCVYTLIYYLYSFNTNYSIKNDLKKFKQLSIIFIISSLCAGAISSGILLAFISEYANIATARNIQVLTQAGTSNLLYIFKNLFAVGYLKTNYFNEYEPLIYCGLIITFFSILFFGNKKIDSAKKKHAIIVILIFFISFCVDFLNKFWHISSPVLLNYRYSIYLGLFLTTLAFENYIKTEKLQKKDIIILSISLVIGLSTIILDSAYVIQSFIFLIVTFLLIILTKNKSKKFEILLCLSIITEIIIMGYTSIYTADDLPLGKSTSYDSLKEVSKFNDFDDNYRVMYNYSYTDYTNDTLLLNKNSSVRYFSSVINGKALEFFNTNFSAVGNNNYRISAYETPLLLSLLGNKYLYLTEELNNGLYNKIDTYKVKSYNYDTKTNETKDVYLYENPYALSLGYVIKKDINTKDDNPVDFQNSIIKSFSGIDKDVMINLENTSTAETEYCDGKIEGTCKLYTINNHTNTPFISIYANFKSYMILNKGVSKAYIETNRPILISTIDKNLEIVLESDSNLDEDRFYTLTYDKYNLIESLESLQKNMLENIKINKNVMTANLNSSEDGILFLSIPYEKNYKIFIDGKKTDYYGLINKTFVGLDINKGKHKITVKYEKDSYKLYIALTAISIVITILLYYFINKSIAKKQILEQKRLEEERTKKQLKKENSKKQKNKKRKK